MLSPESQKTLLAHAREVVVAAAQCQSSPSFPKRVESELGEARAAFVGLHNIRGVRGCVGTTQAAQPLAAVVGDMARAAALRDPRFPPVTPAEVDGLHIEISVLDVPQLIDAPAGIEIGSTG